MKKLIIIAALLAMVIGLFAYEYQSITEGTYIGKDNHNNTHTLVLYGNGYASLYFNGQKTNNGMMRYQFNYNGSVSKVGVNWFHPYEEKG